MLQAIVAAREAGVRLLLEDGKLIAEASEVPPALVAQLQAARSDLLPLLALREAAQPALTAERPRGARATEWADALRGLKKFLAGGWGDQAALLGWSTAELYAVPRVWARVDLTGAALLVGRWQVVDVDAEAIIAKPPWSDSRLKLHRRRDLLQPPPKPAPGVLSESEAALVEVIVDYMRDKVEVSAWPERLLVVMGEPAAVDRAAAISRFMEIDDALFARGIEMWPDHGHIVLGHYWKACPRQKRVTVLSLAAAEAEVAAVVDDEAAIARFKAAAEALFGQGVEVVRGPGVEHLAEDTGQRPAAAASVKVPAPRMGKRSTFSRVERDLPPARGGADGPLI
jgi:hypothetical protein